MMPPLLVDTGEKAGHVDKGDQRDVERITGPNEAGGLLRRLDIEHTGQHHRLVAHHADSTAVEASKATHDALAPRGVVLHEVAVVDDVADHGLHVVGDVGAVGQDRVEFGTRAIGVVARFGLWRDLEVVGRQEGQQILDLIEDFFLAVGDIGGHARLELCEPAPPSSSRVTSSPVTVFTTSGPVMNMCDFSRTMKMKSVIAGLYTAPPAHGPRITEICGMTPDACTLR